MPITCTDYYPENERGNEMSEAGYHFVRQIPELPEPLADNLYVNHMPQETFDLIQDYLREVHEWLEGVRLILQRMSLETYR